MNYQEVLDWMYGQLPMYQKQGASAYRKDLTNTLLLSDYLHHPEKGMKCIHIAGTNGKGSTSSMIASILQEAGYKVGLYTSPHLKDFRERIKISGVMMPKQDVVSFITEHKAFFEQHNLSFFEMTVGLAFWYFKKEQVDFAVIEVGMGGRLDSTNIISPLLSVITNIGLDHTQFLGNTLAEIASEKAGIIKPNTPVVIGEYTPETQPVFIAKAKQEHAPIYFASDLIDQTPESDLKGIYQQKNKKTVLQSIQLLNTYYNLGISPEHINQGLAHVVANTGLLGRWQILAEAPKIIADTAHNKHGLEIVMQQLADQKFNKLHIVLGVVSDKDLESVLPLLPKQARYYFCKPDVPRGLDAVILEEKAQEYTLKGSIFPSVNAALAEAKKNASADDLIYIGGSTFVVAEVV